MHRVLSVIIVGVLIVTLAGCGDDGGDDEGGGDDGAITTTTEEALVGSVDVGACFDDATGDLENAACDAPHSLEVVGVIETPFATVPENVDDELLPACAPVVADYMGLDDVASGIGLDVAYLVPSAAAGEPVAGTPDAVTECMAKSPPGVDLVASVADGGLVEALDGLQPIASMEVGDCFALYDDFPVLGQVGDCSESAAELRYVGSVEADDGDFPGEDTLRALRDEQCPEVAADVDEADPATASGTFPTETDWLAGSRLITCDVAATTG